MHFTLVDANFEHLKKTNPQMQISVLKSFHKINIREEQVNQNWGIPVQIHFEGQCRHKFFPPGGGINIMGEPGFKIRPHKREFQR